MSERVEHNSALHWFPRLLAAHLPVPRSVFVAFDYGKALELLEAVDPDNDPLPVNEVRTACQAIGYPCFIRNDLTSAKHDGPSGYRVDDDAAVGQVLWNNVQDAEMKLWIGGGSPRAFMVRQWLELDAPFTAFQGHPIAREWRLFVNVKDIAATNICEHFYWPEAAIESTARDPNWRDKLVNLSREPIDIRALRHWAALAGVAARDGDWSVDFAYGYDPSQPHRWRWWLIDMAQGAVSWHPEH